MIVVFMTAFYTFRAVFLTFEGEYKGGEAPEHGAHGAAHRGEPHESPWVMALPLLILAVPATLAGFWNAPFNEDIAHLLEGALPLESEELLQHADFSWPIAIGSTVLALAGIGLAWAIYQARAVRSEELQKVFGPVHTLVANKYYVDELYEDVIVRRGFIGVVAATAQWFDTNVVDPVVDGCAYVTRRAGDGLRWVQSGSFQAYGTVGFAGLMVAAILMLVLIEA
jgi:NADH-quinone oxidoreductase subunit L